MHSKERKMRTFHEYGRFLRGDLAAGDLPSRARQKFLLSSREPARDQMLSREGEAVTQPVLADVIQARKIRGFRRGDRAAANYAIHSQVCPRRCHERQVV